jgi:citrate lyase subunit beta/citryl-CoA lyase
LVPGTAPERIAAAATSAADGIILDLEDAVPPGEKSRAREWVVATLKRIDFGGRERIVRINDFETDEGRADLSAIVPAAPDALLLPGVEQPEELERVEEVVARLEADSGLPPGGLRLHLLIETVAGVAHGRTLARASARAATLVFGAVGVARQTGGRLVPARLPELHALSELLLAARLAGLDAIDSPYCQLRDMPGLEAHARFAAELGYDGKAVIHPEQVEVVNRVFTPAPEAVAEARRVLHASGDPDMRGGRPGAVDGRPVDAARVTMARQVLARAEGARQP